jgi:hypothetical protein
MKPYNLLSEVTVYEVFDNPAPFKRYQSDDIEVADFTVGDISYQVAYRAYPNGEGVFGFASEAAEDQDQDIPNTHQNSSKVFATVIAFMKEILQEKQPDVWFLDKENDRKDRLYRAILSKMMLDLKNAGYTPYRYPNDLYKFFRDGVPPEPGFLKESSVLRYFNHLFRIREWMESKPSGLDLGS